MLDSSQYQNQTIPAIAPHAKVMRTSSANNGCSWALRPPPPAAAPVMVTYLLY